MSQGGQFSMSLDREFDLAAQLAFSALRPNERKGTQPVPLINP